MTNKEKYPELWKKFEELRAKKEKLDKVVAPLRQQRDELAKELAPVEAKMRKLAEKIKAHMPEMAAIDRELGALARGMGGKTV